MNANVNAGAEALGQALVENLHRVQAKLPRHATPNDWYMALAHTIRDRLMDRYIAHLETLTTTESVKVVAYLSAEFLTGPHLGNSLLSLGLWDEAERAVSKVGQELTTLLEQEEEPGLGNGGLGRLAACYMDSLATLNVPAIGYGIRYEFGIFDQAIRDGWQIELTDKWLRYGNPWEIVRSETTFDVKFGGRTERYSDEHGHERVRWLPARAVKGVAYDTPVPGYRAPTVDILRLWKAEAAESFDFEAFNVGDYYRAVDNKVESETITKVLYPNDEPVAGKKLRLLQQFFFVSCSLQDMLRLHLMRGKRVDEFDRGWAVQLNDTHPSIAVAELMRLLIDEHLLPWEERVGRHGADLRLHEPHAPGRSAREMAAAAVRRHPAAPPGDHLRDQPALPRRRAIAVSRRRSAAPPPVAHRRDRRTPRAHGAPRRGRQPRHQRGRGAALGAPQADRAARLPPGRAGKVLQRDQWRHAAALAGAEQPAAERAHHAAHRRSVARRPRARTGAHRAARRRCRLPAGLARREGRQQAATGRPARRTVPVSSSIRRRCSTSR